MPGRLLGRITPVYDKLRARNEGRLVRDKVEHPIGDFFGIGVTMGVLVAPGWIELHLILSLAWSIAAALPRRRIAPLLAA